MNEMLESMSNEYLTNVGTIKTNNGTTFSGTIVIRYGLVFVRNRITRNFSVVSFDKVEYISYLLTDEQNTSFQKELQSHNEHS